MDQSYDVALNSYEDNTVQSEISVTPNKDEPPSIVSIDINEHLFSEQII